MSKTLDPFWDYAEPLDPQNRQKLKCNLCGKEMTGGISRLKYHFAQLSGHEVDICKNSTPEIIHRAKLTIESIGKKKDEREALRQELGMRVSLGSGTVGHTLGGVGSETFSSSSAMPSTTSNYYVPRSGPGAQPGIKSMFKINEKKEADKLVSRCLLWSDIPFHFARNPFYVPMFDAIATVGPGYKPPTYEELRGPLLDNEKVDCTTRLEELRGSWEFTGCTVMSDGWTDTKGRTLLNFLVHCPRGIMFIKSVDASAHIKDATLLCELLDGFIQEVGLQHVSYNGQCCELCGSWQDAYGHVSFFVLDPLCCTLYRLPVFKACLTSKESSTYTVAFFFSYDCCSISYFAACFV